MDFCKIARSFDLLPHPVSELSPLLNPRDLVAPAPRPLQKGQQTRAAILDAALGLAAHRGLEGLSIGAIAEITCMS